MNNSNRVIGKCFICYGDNKSTINSREGKLFYIVGKGDTGEEKILKKELTVMFLLKKFFIIPEEMCCQFLQQYGNPSSWICWCDSCSILIDEAKNLFEQVKVLEKKMNQLKIKLESKLNSSVNESREAKTTKAKEEPTKTIRTIIAKNTSYHFDEDNVKKEVKRELVSDDEDEDAFEYSSADNPENDVSNEYQDLDDIDDDESLINFIAKEETTESEAHNPLRLKLECNLCPKRFSTEEKLRNHQLRKHQSRKKRSKSAPPKKLSYKCILCDEEFNNRKDFKFHRNFQHKASFPCSHCGKVFVKYAYLRQHLRLHTDRTQSAFQCSTCGKRFLHKKSMTDHENIHKQDNPFRCTTCGKHLSSPNNLSQHMLIHNGGNKEKPYLCPICGMAFARVNILNVHERVHTGEKPHSCRFCDMKFAQKGSLVHHEKTHTREKPFTCSFCEERFTYRLTLKRHLRTHTGEPAPHKCSFCDRRFETGPEKIAHERTHTKEKPFSCEICGKRFTMAGSKTKHILIVHEKMPGKYSCSICQSQFHKKDRLVRHERTHSQESS